MQWASDFVKDCFSSPLTNSVVIVTVSHGDLELASDVIGTDYLAGDDDAFMHIFEIAEDSLAEAMKEAKDEITRLKEVEV